MVMQRRTAACLGAALAVLFSATAMAQQPRGSITGVVRAAQTQRPVVGAQVFIPNTNFGALTDANGRYAIQNVPAGERTVHVQMLGYKLLERRVTVRDGAPTVADFALAESAVALDEIVVTGTAGEVRKREIGTSMATISAAEISTAPVVSTQDILSGRAAGATVMMNTGQPGAGGTIRLRGNNSIAQSNNPLVYVDGVRIFSDFAPSAWASRQNTLPLNDINAEDIDRIEVVKGAAATTLYGTEASGGVIQIFTKSGRAGAPQWSTEISGGYNTLGHVGPDSDPTGLYMNECRGPNMLAFNDRTGELERFEDATCPSSGSWIQKGALQRYSLSVRGGAQELTYYLSGNYNSEEGAVETGESKDGGFRGNFSFRPADNLEFALTSSYTRRNTRWVPDGNNASGFLLNVMRGRDNNFKDSSQCADTSLAACTINGEILKQQNFNRQDHFITGLTVQHETTSSLSNRVSIGWDYNAADNQTLYPFGFSRTPKGLIFANTWNHTTLSLDYRGQLQNTLGSALASTFSWGGQMYEDRSHYNAIDAYDFAGPGEPTLTSAARQEVDIDDRLRVITAGVFLQELLGWRDRLFVTAGMRVDGNSAFGDEFGLQLYPKLSASYVMSDHAFWPTDWWETLKLRAAVGESGKAPGAFDAVRTWEPIAGDEGQPGFTPDQVGNPNLGPERSREYEAGIEASIFDGRLGIDFTYYSQRTLDALVQVTYPPSEGFSARQLENVGELKNRGVELRLDLGLLRLENLDWSGRFNVGTNRTEAVDLAGQSIYLGDNQEAREGFAVPAYWAHRILNPDEFADPIISDTLEFIGPAYPTTTLSVGTTLGLFANRLMFDVLGEHQGGHYLANWVGYQNARRGVWEPCHAIKQKLFQAEEGNAAAIADVRAADRARCAIDRTVMSDEYWIDPADFWKLRSVSVTYQLPQRFMLPQVRNASITVAGRNLWSSTDYTGVDPEVRDGIDADFGLTRREYYNLPPLRQFVISVRANF